MDSTFHAMAIYEAIVVELYLYLVIEYELDRSAPAIAGRTVPRYKKLYFEHFFHVRSTLNIRFK